jgi:hypothetical protein
VAQTQSTSSRERSQNASSNGDGNAHGVMAAAGEAGRSVTRSAAFPLATAMAGAAAALAMAQRKSSRRKKVLGVSIPGTGSSSDGLARNVGEAAKQLARLADEVRTGRKKAEEIGRALS